MGPHKGKSDTDKARYQTWTLEGEHSETVELTRAIMVSMSSREQGRGSGRKRAPDSAVLATISSADAIVDGYPNTRGGDEEALLLISVLSQTEAFLRYGGSSMCT